MCMPERLLLVRPRAIAVGLFAMTVTLLAAAASDDEARLLEWRMILPTEGAAHAAVARLRAAGHDVAGTPDGSVVSDPWGTKLRLATR